MSRQPAALDWCLETPMTRRPCWVEISTPALEHNYRILLGLAEDNAHTQYLGVTIGPITPLRPDEVAVIAGHTSSEKSVRKAFHYEEETARRAGALDGLGLVPAQG